MYWIDLGDGEYVNLARISRVVVGKGAAPVVSYYLGANPLQWFAAGEKGQRLIAALEAYTEAATCRPAAPRPLAEAVAAL